MYNLYEINGTYGSGNIPTTIYVLETYDGQKWYAAENSQNINMTYDHITEGINIEDLNDFDCYTYNKGVNSLDDLEKSWLE